MSGSRIDKVVCSQRELFEIVRNDWHSNFHMQLLLVEQHFAAKMKRFIIHFDDRKKVKDVLSKLQPRWKQYHRIIKRFLKYH